MHALARWLLRGHLVASPVRRIHGKRSRHQSGHEMQQQVGNAGHDMQPAILRGAPRMVPPTPHPPTPPTHHPVLPMPASSASQPAWPAPAHPPVLDVLALKLLEVARRFLQLASNALVLDVDGVVPGGRRVRAGADRGQRGRGWWGNAGGAQTLGSTAAYLPSGCSMSGPQNPPQAPILHPTWPRAP